MRLRYFEGEILIGAARGSMLGELRNVDFLDDIVLDVFMDFLDGCEESFRYMGNMRGCFCFSSFSSFRSRFNGSTIRFGYESLRKLELS